MNTQEKTVAIIGVGNLGAAIATGLSQSELNFNILLVNRTVEKSHALAKQLSRGEVVDLSAAVSRADKLVIAVKPPMVLEVCQQLSSLCAKEGKTPLVISVAASPTLAETRTALGTGVRVARVIPSITVSVCSGIAAVFSDVEADAQQATDLFEQIGAVLKVKSESEFDAVLGMCASGLGFLALVAEALAEGGVKMGLTSADALKCASYTMLGAGKLLEESGMHPAELRNRVASPGGTTIAGLHELEKAGVRGAFISAIEAAVVRARK